MVGSSTDLNPHGRLAEPPPPTQIHHPAHPPRRPCQPVTVQQAARISIPDGARPQYYYLCRGVAAGHDPQQGVDAPGSTGSHLQHNPGDNLLPKPLAIE